MMRWLSLIAGLAVAGALSAQDHSSHSPTPAATGGRSSHVPPDPPQHEMRDMSEKEMIELMDMDDTAALFMLKGDEFEWRKGEVDHAFGWNVEGWYGGDYNKAWLKTDGDARGGTTEFRAELLWDRVLSPWWSVQTGLRYDQLETDSRTWLAFGVQGLAPYWFEVEATAYLGQEGRSALRLAVDYELRLTQRTIVQPELELEFFGTEDADNGIGSGLASSELSLRLRYEMGREFAPYVGVAWRALYGGTADFATAAGRDSRELEWLAGIRWWF